jgi:hypothetical protein
MGEYQDLKIVLMQLFGLGKDALHIYVGLAVFLLTAILFRLPLRDWRPLAAVFLAAVAGELVDLFEWSNRATGALVWRNHWHDVWNTMFWPTVLFLLSRSPRLLKR